MNCLTCNVALQMTERQGIEIDYCPRCRGVWIDRGELDRVIERAVSERRSSDLSDRENEIRGCRKEKSMPGADRKKGGLGALFLFFRNECLA